MPRIMLTARVIKIYRTEFLSLKSLQSIGGDKHDMNILHSCVISAEVQYVSDTKVAKINN